MTPDLKLRARRAVQVIAADGRALEAGRASLFVAREIGIWPRLAALASLPPLVWMVELGYRLVADHRALFDPFLFRSIPQAVADAEARADAPFA